ncbi:nuclear transport factor 2 family protein [soil metagenome]
MAATELVDRYFELARQRGDARYLAQFESDAAVEDEGLTYRGIDAIRDWRGAVPAVSYAVRDVRVAGDETVALAQISGDFPGSPVDLSFRFTFTSSGSIQALAIRT